MEKYIELDLKNNPQFFKKPHSGKFVDLSVVCHVVCNVNRPEDVPAGAFTSCMDAVATEVDMIPPLENVVPVVRCRECKHLNVVNNEKLYAHCPKTNTVFLPFQLDTRTHFCSLGERR